MKPKRPAGMHHVHANVRFFLAVLLGLVLAASPLAQAALPGEHTVILPDPQSTNAPGYLLVWPTTPGVRYQPQKSVDLKDWTTLSGYPSNAPGLAQQHRFVSDTNRLFFRVQQLDEQPPEILTRYPENKSFGIRCKERIQVQLDDRTAINPASLQMTVGGLGTFGTTNGFLIITNNQLVFNADGTNSLGTNGESVTISLVAADTLGNQTTNTWSFDLELAPVVATNLFVFGSTEAQQAGQLVGSAPRLRRASLADSPPVRNAGAEPWVLTSVETNRLVITYTNGSAPNIPVNTYLCNQAPTKVGEIFYRQVLSISNDSGSQQLTLFTTNVSLERFVQEGSLSANSDTQILQVDTNGTIIRSLTVEGEVTFPRSGFSLDGREFRLKNKDNVDIIRLTATELHWWFTPKIKAGLEITWGGLKRFEAVASGHSEEARIFDADVLLLGAAEDFKLFELFPPEREHLKPRTWIYWGNIGIVPVYAELSFDMEAKATFEAKAMLNFHYGTRQTSDMAFGLHYENSEVDWIREFKVAPAQVEPFTADIKGELSMALSVEPQMEFLVYGLAGFSAGVTPSVGITFEDLAGDAPLTGTLELGVTFDISAAGPAFDALGYKPEFSAPIWGPHEWILFPQEADIQIQTQPQGQTIRFGEAAYFTCSATANKSLSYQWYHNGVPLPGQTENTLLLPRVIAGHAGDYFVRLTAGNQSSNSAIATLTVIPKNIPSGMVLIPNGNFPMEGNPNAQPVHAVYGSAFYIDKCEVKNSLWEDNYRWATNHGYAFDNTGSAKGTSHPVHSVNWFDVVKWCNARSEKEGKIPAYYTDASMTVLYKTGQIVPHVNWERGYRLPTEWEWEKAARGGLSGKRFPWGDTISHKQANYYAGYSYPYDLSYPDGYHPDYQYDGYPYTSPVGSFSPNRYGLYDMAGNVWEWCWDLYGSYEGATYRVIRGGHWLGSAEQCQLAYREASRVTQPIGCLMSLGFRSVLPPGQ